jgi:hypothetical protein
LVQDARLMLGRGRQKDFLRGPGALGLRYGDCLILVLTFASSRGGEVKKNAVFYAVAVSCVEAIGRPIAVERTLVFVRSSVDELAKNATFLKLLVVVWY